MSDDVRGAYEELVHAFPTAVRTGYTTCHVLVHSQPPYAGCLGSHNLCCLQQPVAQATPQEHTPFPSIIVNHRLQQLQIPNSKANVSRVKVAANLCMFPGPTHSI